MRAITNIATTMPVTRPALQRKLLHWAAARLATMTNGARTAARMRKRPRFRRSQAWVNSSYLLAAPSPAFLDLCGCAMPTSMSPMRVQCGRNSNPAWSTPRDARSPSPNRHRCRLRSVRSAIRLRAETALARREGPLSSAERAHDRSSDVPWNTESLFNPRNRLSHPPPRCDGYPLPVKSVSPGGIGGQVSYKEFWSESGRRFQRQRHGYRGHAAVIALDDPPQRGKRPGSGRRPRRSGSSLCRHPQR